jgi:D-xylose transport system permease protein
VGTELEKLPVDPAAIETETDEAALEEAAIVAPEVLAGSLQEYLRLWWRRIRSGESSTLPVTIGLIAIVIYFQARDSLFLSAGNLVNLAVQGAPIVVLGMAEVFVLLLGEIDLSVGYNAAIGGVVTAWAAFSLPWWIAIILGLAASAFIGLVLGTLVTRLRLPSFVVTLAGLLGLEGLLLNLVPWTGHGSGGTIPVSSHVINDITGGNMSPTLGWIVMVGVVAVAGVAMFLRARSRRANNLAAPPLGIIALRVAVMAIAGVVVVLVGNTNRGRLTPVRGVPWIVVIVLALLALWTLLLSRTRFGRYVYAIGGNAEAARRAGVNLAMVRTGAFMLTGLTAGIAGVIYASWLGSVSSDFNGGQYVLWAVAAAVIGGTHLFGGVGKILHALLGGVVVAAIYNGLSLLGTGAATTDIVTALVLLAAVSIDTLTRRGRSA